jgi:hypothetical protein
MSRRRKFRPTPLYIQADEELDRHLADLHQDAVERQRERERQLGEGLDLVEEEKTKKGVRPCPPMAGSEEEVLKRVRSGDGTRAHLPQIEIATGVDMTGLLDSARGLVSRDVSVFPVHYPVECNGRLQCGCGNGAARARPSIRTADT